MAIDNKAFQVQIQGGGLLDLTPNILKTYPTLNNPSQTNALFKPVNGANDTQLYTARILKDTKRPLIDRSPGTGKWPTINQGTHSTTLLFGEQTISVIDRNDSIVINAYDKIATDKLYSTFAAAAGKWILTASELDLKEIISDIYDAAKATKIYTAVDAANNNAPTGTQPVAADATTAKNIDAILKGARVTKPITDLETGDNAVNIIRAAIATLNQIGSPNSPEKLYPFSINGIPLDDLIIACKYYDAIKIKSSLTMAFIDMNDINKVRNYNGIVGFIDTIPVIITNQLAPESIDTGAAIAYYVGSNRAGTRNIIPTSYIASWNPMATTTVDSTGKIVKLAPSDGLLEYESPRRNGALYFEEAIFIEKAA